MAIGTYTRWELRPTNGGANNGGGFNAENVNFSNDLTATSANTSAPVVSSASYNFVAGDVGCWIFIKSGTNWLAGWYQIASVASNIATLTATIGTAIIYKTANIIGYQDSLSTVIGCATTASPTSGVWSVDYSQKNSAQVAFTDMVQVTTTTTTSAVNPFGKNHVGNIIYVSGGTGTWTQQFVEIISVTTVTATVDKTLGGTGGTGGTGNLGGARSGYSNGTITLQANLVAGNKLYIKNEVWNEAVSLTVDGTATYPIVHEGYNTQRCDEPTGNNRPTNNRGSAGGDGITITSLRAFFRNIIVKNAGGSGFKTNNIYQNFNFENCRATANGADGFSPNSSSVFSLTKCESDNNAGFGIGGVSNGSSIGAIGCYFHDNASAGIATTNGGLFLFFCISESNAGSGVSMNGSNGGVYIANCTFHNNSGSTSDGLTNYGSLGFFYNNIFSYNGRYGAYSSYLGGSYFSDYNNYFGNKTAASSNHILCPNDKFLDPQFTDAGEKTFVDANVNTSTEEITITGHGYLEGEVGQLSTTGTLPAGLSATAVYYVLLVSSNVIKLSATRGGSAVNITGASGGGTHTIRCGSKTNFSLGTNLKALGFPGNMGVSTGYTDIGAIQRQEAGGGGQKSYTFGG